MLEILPNLKTSKIVMISNTISDCSIIDLSKIYNEAGNITVVENNSDFPFNVKRVFYSYDIPGGEDRGGHAHNECNQFLIAASGSFQVHLDDGKSKKTIFLNQPSIGLHIPPGIWASEVNFSSGSICMVLASHLYEEDDYIRDYNKYIEEKK
jgi:dTDP-4-dehydrorhamnose 3,5-epimerase-like enzyme